MFQETMSVLSRSNAGKESVRKLLERNEEIMRYYAPTGMLSKSRAGIL